jgi:hypothetical protein
MHDSGAARREVVNVCLETRVWIDRHGERRKAAPISVPSTPTSRRCASFDEGSEPSSLLEWP